jgi:hypothetical protein
LTRSFQALRHEQSDDSCPAWCRDSEPVWTQPVRRFSYGYDYAQVGKPGISAANECLTGCSHPHAQGRYR